MGAASILLNSSTVLWVTGGTSGHQNGVPITTKSTEYVRLESGKTWKGETVSGPDLPVAVRGHCLVKLNEETVIMIGGANWSNSQYYHETWLFHVKNESWTEGPPVNSKREGHMCGIIDFNNTQMVVVAGGLYFKHENSNEVS